MVTGIRVLTFITEDTNNESASFVQKPPTSRAFLRKSQRSDTQGSLFQSVSQSVNSSHSSHTVEVKQSKSSSRSLFIRSLGWFCRFDSVKVESDQSLRLLRRSTTSSIRLAVRIWARSRQSSYSATLLLCVIKRSCWRKYTIITLNNGVILFQPPLLS